MGGWPAAQAFPFHLGMSFSANRRAPPSHMHVGFRGGCFLVALFLGGPLTPHSSDAPYCENPIEVAGNRIEQSVGSGIVSTGCGSPGGG
eukprot:437197-Amphidinium_carterae.1